MQTLGYKVFRDYSDKIDVSLQESALTESHALV